MTMQDPISDMLTRIRNAQMVMKKIVDMPMSKVKMAIAAVLKDEGFVSGYSEVEGTVHPTMRVELKYHNDRPVIDSIQRVSKPSLRIYKQTSDLPKVKDGLGVAIVSTSQGVMTGRKARKLNLGGEILVYVS
jgi:small subunit ribosomal protein S8